MTSPSTAEQPTTLAAAPQKETTLSPEGCVIEKFTVFSQSMNRHIKTVVVLPPDYAQNPAARHPVLYALHGMDAPHVAWSEMIPLRRTLAAHPMLLVCFDGDKAGWYLDSTKNPANQFTTFFFHELIPHIDAHYRTRPDGASRGVTGFSMGGYGAFHYMLTHPEKFASVSALSGAFHRFGELGNARRDDTIVALLGTMEENTADYRRHGIYNRIEEHLAKGVTLPPIYVRCGAEDYLIDDNRTMVKFLLAQNEKLSKSGMPPQIFHYSELSGGHDWPFWRDSSDLVADFHWRSFQPPFKPTPTPAAAAPTPAT